MRVFPRDFIFSISLLNNNDEGEGEGICALFMMKNCKFRVARVANGITSEDPDRRISLFFSFFFFMRAII